MDSKAQLLSTIRLPNNLKLLSDRLPKSKYDEGDSSQHASVMRGRVHNVKGNAGVGGLPQIMDTSEVSASMILPSTLSET